MFKVISLILLVLGLILVLTALVTIKKEVLLEYLLPKAPKKKKESRGVKKEVKVMTNSKSIEFTGENSASIQGECGGTEILKEEYRGTEILEEEYKGTEILIENREGRQE